MADPYRITEDWQDGYDAGYDSGFSAGMKAGVSPISRSSLAAETLERGRPRRKRKQGKKQKILNEMADKKWRKYKKGSGKKTYFDIRGQVSRSEAYKKKVKNL